MYIKSTSHIGFSDCADPAAWLKNLKPIRANNQPILPEYKDRLNPRLLRRMSPVLKMGAYNALDCLAKADNAIPDAIIVGTGLGCSEDTLKFLNEINTNFNAALSPTAFIRSTHNTIAGQIALLLKNQGYNMTFTQSSLSFESALSDAMSAMKANEISSALVGGIDELSEGLNDLLTDLAKGMNTEIPVIGQGSSFFLLDGEPAESAVEIIDVTSYHDGQTAENIDSFLAKNAMKMGDIDLILDGTSFSETDDDNPSSVGRMTDFTHAPNSKVENIAYQYPHLNTHTSVLNYKKYCGEYFAASGFATILANAILQTGILPGGASSQAVKTLLINSGFGLEQGVILLRKV